MVIRKNTHFTRPKKLRKLNYFAKKISILNALRSDILAQKVKKLTVNMSPLRNISYL